MVHLLGVRLSRRRIKLMVLAAIALSTGSILTYVVHSWLMAQRAQVDLLTYWRYPVKDLGTTLLESDRIDELDSYRLAELQFGKESNQLEAFVYEWYEEVYQDGEYNTYVPTIDDHLSLHPIGHWLRRWRSREYIATYTYIDPILRPERLGIASAGQRLLSVGGTGGDGIAANIWDFQPTSSRGGTTYQQTLVQTVDIVPRTLSHEVAISSDGSWFATSSREDGDSKIWIGRVSSTELASGSDENNQSLNSALLHEITVKRMTASLQFSPDGDRLLAVDWADSFQLFDTQTGEIIGAATLSAIDDFIPAIAAYSSDGQRFSILTSDSLYIWEADSNRLLNKIELEDLPSPVTRLGLALSTDGKWAATSSGDEGQIYIWDVETGERLRVLSSPILNFGEIEFSQDNTRLAAGSPPNAGPPRVTLWELPDQFQN